jgi:hypothetical protein
MPVVITIGIVSDGKFGDRAFEIIREKFPTVWIPAPFPSAIMVDDIGLDVPDCDLYISYARHPDVILTLLGKKRPVILGINPGPGFLRQAKAINEDIIAPVTMCSLEPDTWVPAINEFAAVFGRPAFDISVRDDGTIERVRVTRGSPCGSTVAASAELPGTQVSPEQLRHYGLRICHFCRAPRFGKTCDKSRAGVLHICELVNAIRTVSPATYERVRDFTDELEREGCQVTAEP